MNEKMSRKELEELIKKEGNRKELNHRGYEYIISRGANEGSSMFHLCGYVALPRTHPLNEVDYDVAERVWGISVHGGLTFADFLPVVGERRYCYGFDCAHTYDLSSWRQFDDDGILPDYRNMQYVEDECQALIDQLINIDSLVDIGKVNNYIIGHKVVPDVPCKAVLRLWNAGGHPMDTFYCKLESGHTDPHRNNLRYPLKDSLDAIHMWRETND